MQLTEKVHFENVEVMIFYFVSPKGSHRKLDTTFFILCEGCIKYLVKHSDEIAEEKREREAARHYKEFRGGREKAVEERRELFIKAIVKAVTVKLLSFCLGTGIPKF